MNANPPVKVGDEIEVIIESLGEKGDGVAKISGYVVFVKNVNKGDKLKIRVTKTLNKVGFGEVISEGSASSESAETDNQSSEGSYEVQGSHEKNPEI